MARGRMLNQTISASVKFQRLPDDTCRLLATWIIPHLDLNGVFYGDPAMVRAYVFPRRTDVSVEQVAACLEALEEVGLIVRFRARDDTWLWWPGFLDNQTGLRRERETTTYPEPPLSHACEQDAHTGDEGSGAPDRDAPQRDPDPPERPDPLSPPPRPAGGRPSPAAAAGPQICVHQRKSASPPLSAAKPRTAEAVTTSGEAAAGPGTAEAVTTSGLAAGAGTAEAVTTNGEGAADRRHLAGMGAAEEKRRKEKERKDPKVERAPGAGPPEGKNGAGAPSAGAASVSSFPRTFQEWEAALERYNPPALARRMCELLYPDHEPPDYGLVGATAKRMGSGRNGYRRLIGLLWEYAAKAPQGDVLPYLLRVHQGREDGYGRHRAGGAEAKEGHGARIAREIAAAVESRTIHSRPGSRSALPAL